MDHKTFFNNLAADWDNMPQPDQKKLTHIAARLQLHAGQAVLDVGTGTGVMLPFLREGIGPDGTLIAVDIAEKMIAKASEKYASLARFQTADVAALPFADGSFDRVICYSAFPHFPDKEMALREMARVLKPTGAIFVAHSAGREHVNHFHHSLKSFVSHDHLPDDEEMRRLGTATGCEADFIENSQDYYILQLRKGQLA
ncbi:MAG TPA: class I SAM-dependent methyltransferase [Negativicutes bacterium]|nr:class I SAM-dependent methyltransferase [Negativicutes bacterium]